MHCLRAWRLYRLKVRRRQRQQLREAVYGVILDRWYRAHWARLPPPEGWHPYFNVDPAALLAAKAILGDEVFYRPVTAHDVAHETGVPVEFVSRYFIRTPLHQAYTHPEAPHALHRSQ